MPSVERPISARLEQLLRDLVRRVSALERPVRRVIPVVTSLPASPDPNEEVYLRHVAGAPLWRCVWDATRNVWQVIGAAPIFAQQTGQTTTTGDTTQTMTNGPFLTVPVTGRYLLEGGGSVAMANAPGGIVDWVVSVARSGLGIVELARGTLPNSAWVGRHTTYRRIYGSYHFSAGQVASYRIRAALAAAQMRWGDYIPWQLAMTPVELDPA